MADSKHLISKRDNPIPGLATIYRDGGHGVLVAPKWVVTVAHATFCLRPGRAIEVDGQKVAVARIHNHPDYQPQATHDIALLELATPITSSDYMALPDHPAQAGQIIRFAGIGGTGNGLTGQTIDNGENQGRLRYGENRISRIDPLLIYSDFDKPTTPHALPLEASLADGDSGTPLMVEQQGQQVLVGLASRALKPFEPAGKYGAVDIHTRVLPFVPWIKQVMTATQPDTQLSVPITGRLPFGVRADQLNSICKQINF
ncbi:S1 family peptidase [Pseudoalteromonas rubra]|uniref:S1 family peptidase n=1 Tax=Pseudoalteromonas rubra TaxID=43658 RepID=UPI0013DDAC74|nr:trypsin-like serine protease [Pseudoalteromonas rubra]